MPALEDLNFLFLSNMVVIIRFSISPKKHQAVNSYFAKVVIFIFENVFLIVVKLLKARKM